MKISPTYYLRKLVRTAGYFGAAFLLTTQCWAFPARCVGVIDGDTILIQHWNKAEIVRIYGIDAPESGQRYGHQATMALMRLVYLKPIEIDPVSGKSYGRMVARVHCEGQDISEVMIEQGAAWWYSHFAPYDKRLERAEFRAARDGRGLWQEENPQAPWLWRLERRKR